MADAGASATDAHYRLQLREIEADLTAGRLAPAEADGARRELAREYLRTRDSAGPTARAEQLERLFVPGTLVVVAGLALATYAAIGRPDLPAQPLAARPEAALAGMTLEQAVAQIEARLSAAPDDARGWMVVGPAYMQLGRYADAERAFRRLLELAPPTAEVETDLAEVILLQNGGSMAGEPSELLESAIARDPTQTRARFYLAGEATRAGDWQLARERWTDLIALAQGNETWLPVARDGLEAAEEGLAEAGVAAAAPPEDAPLDDAIRGMVEGLAARLDAQGGTIEEWTRLVQSRLVLEEPQAAQAAYDAAAAAYPNPSVRAELDAIAREGNLTIAGGTP